jgi:hypothetical protein
MRVSMSMPQLRCLLISGLTLAYKIAVERKRMAYKCFEIPSRNGERSDTVYTDFEFPDRPCFTEAIGFEAGDWSALARRMMAPREDRVLQYF